jgi:hypothetical protein
MRGAAKLCFRKRRCGSTRGTTAEVASSVCASAAGGLSGVNKHRQGELLAERQGCRGRPSI